MTHDQATYLVVALCSAYPVWRPGESDTALWAEMLQPLDWQSAQATVRTLIQTHRGPYPPSIAEILQAARAHEGRVRPRALEEPVDTETARKMLAQIRRACEIGKEMP